MTIKTLLERFHEGDQVQVVRDSASFNSYLLSGRNYSGTWTIGKIFPDGSHFLHQGGRRVDAILDMLQSAAGPW